MKKVLLYGTLLIVSAFIFLGVTSPKHEHIHRSIEINKPVAEVFAYLADYNNMSNWSPWAEMDPNAKSIITGIPGSVGHKHRWESENKDVGVGEQQIVGLDINNRIDTQLKFEAPMEMTSSAYFNTKANGETTTLTWGYETDYGFVDSIFMRFFDLDALLGKNYEDGLAKLKSVLEK